MTTNISVCCHFSNQLNLLRYLKIILFPAAKYTPGAISGNGLKPSLSSITAVHMPETLYTCTVAKSKIVL